MSADNGIYIVKFPEGYRVSYAGGIDNIDYFPQGSKSRKAVLKSYFGKSKLFNTKDEAYHEAKIIQNKKGTTEYGICYLGEYESF